MDKKLDELYHSAHIADSLKRHGLEEKVAHEIADIFLQSTSNISLSVNDLQRIEYLDSFSESENNNARGDYLNSRSAQVIEADKNVLKKYLQFTLQRLSKTNAMATKHEGYVHNSIKDIGSIVWSKSTLELINNWQTAHPTGGDKQYKHVELSFVPGSSVSYKK